SGSAQMDEADGWRLKASEDSGSQAEPDSPVCYSVSDYKELQIDLKSDAQNLEAETWSLAVDQNYLKSLNKDAIERQDAIYELIQTEMHHVRTLKILTHIYMYELKQSLRVDNAWLEQLFPGVEVLLGLHQLFLNLLKERQKESQEEGSSKNYYITQLGDILINQFSGLLGDQMMATYGYFCSKHSEAVSLYKEQLQSNKKLQAFIKKMDQFSLVRRLGIPECFLLVTQRITKYPFLVERIIKNTEADSEECRSLVKGLELIKDTICQVNSQVREHEMSLRLREIGLRLEPKTQVRMKDGRVFRREELTLSSRCLLHEGVVALKSSGKQKEVLAVLLSDVLLFLQEKDQKFVFASVDNNQPVIFLQRVIVREVAHEDKGLYIICACTVGMAGMYEIYAGSKEERDKWMTLIREAEMDSVFTASACCCSSDLLRAKDDLLEKCLTEKQEIFDALYKQLIGQESPHQGLLLRGDASDLQQGEALLNEAIKDAEILQNRFFMRIRDPNLPPEEAELQGGRVRRAQTFAGWDDNPNINCKTFLLKYLRNDGHCLKSNFLFMAQAVIAQQDSRIEMQKAFQMKNKLPSRSYNNMLLEQEKQRTLKKQKEEMADLQKQQAQLRDERQRWEKETEQQRLQVKALETELQQREEACRRREEKLEEENSELKKQREAYQKNLEILRVTSKKIEKDKEDLEKRRLRLNQNPPFEGGSVPMDIPPRVPPRRESISPRPISQKRPPARASSTTSHRQKAAMVQQQIPQQLATSSKSRYKSYKSKRAHKRAHSAGRRPTRAFRNNSC
uniref:Rho/rac guanine nucleotide exchange factor (GEF) 18a n=1 Tax=Kryptolebias marmoratus TaxID=37003 RepID=A0A3Q3H2Q6_KRYMA